LNDKLTLNENSIKNTTFFINYCWRFGFDWSLRRKVLSNRRSVSGRTGCRRSSKPSTTTCSPRNWVANGD